MLHIVLDLEATCSNVQDNFLMEIIEIGAVAINDRGEILDTYDIFVKPVINPKLTEFCKNLTTIKQSDVNTAPHFQAAMKSFLNWIDRHNEDDEYSGLKIWSWGYYDKNQFMKDCALHGLSIFWLRDRHYNLRVAFKNRHKLHKNPGMDVALNMKNIPLVGTHHRGIDDAKNLAEIFIDDMQWFIDNTPASE